ncbi:ParA family protein [Alienimonas californiensis]|uniref:MinD/ParA/CobQ/CobA-like protein n=1 Tax=Alienimonas californiensis TaxID=2527989 RepID=A0A517PCT6_9PLAN|nr:ParA family protein [Alienimonas californiensis]QDT17193.1 MinD/ParA/CobQ/CobA-like protein [Alienimonas californiensis]
MGDVGHALAEFVREVAPDFDYVVLDSPPDVSNLPTWSCLMAAEHVLVPIVPETFSAQAIAGVDRTLATAQAANRKLRFLGYVVNLRKTISTYHEANEERLRAIHGDRVLNTVLTNLTAFAEAQGLRKSVAEYAPNSAADKLTREFCDEVLVRIERQAQARKAA